MLKNKKYLLLAITVLITNMAIADSTGLLRIKADLEDAWIYVDGKKKARTTESYVAIEVQEGEHEILIKTNNNEKKKSVFVGEGVVVPLNFIFQAQDNSVIEMKAIPIVTNAIVYCDYTIGFSRSDHGANNEYHTVMLPGDPGDSFRFSGCSSQYKHGKMCVRRYGVRRGARLIRNQRDVVVAEGNCCNDVQNRITSVRKNCYESSQQRSAPEYPYQHR